MSGDRDRLRMRLVQAYDALEDGHEDRAEEIIRGAVRGLPQPTASSDSQPDRMLLLERGSDLLAEPDPGPTPYLVEGLIVDPAIAVVVGAWKVAKTYVQIELAIAVVTGRKAFNTYEVPTAGPVILVMEESGRAAFHRRLDRLSRGYALKKDALSELHFAANQGVRLNDPRWQNDILDAGTKIKPRAFIFDPFVRVKGSNVDESSQRETGPVLDFMRLLRDECQASVLYSHHTGHQGSHQRGSSDLEGYWESRLALTKDEHGVRTVEVGHREAESGHSFTFMLDFDDDTRSLRLQPVVSDLERLVRQYLTDHPTASKNEVAKNVDGRRSDVLRIYDVVKGDVELTWRTPHDRVVPNPGTTGNHPRSGACWGVGS